MNKKKNGLIVFLLLFSFQRLELQAQDPVFSQFYANPIYLNPALAGAAVCPRFILNYRNQWPAIGNGFVTYAASYDQYLKSISSAVAVTAMSDRMGDGSISSNSIGGVYAYRIRLTENFFIHTALQATYVNRVNDWAILTFSDQYNQTGLVNPVSADPDANKNNSLNEADFSGGLVGSSDRFYIGFALHHFYQTPMDEWYKFPMKYTLHGGINFPLDITSGGEPIVISPAVLCQFQGRSQQFNYGLHLDIHPLFLGVWLRHGTHNVDAALFSAGITYQKFRFGYSYDWTLSPLKQQTGGAHEVSFAIILPCAKESKAHARIPCPKF